MITFGDLCLNLEAINRLDFDINLPDALYVQLEECACEYYRQFSDQYHGIPSDDDLIIQAKIIARQRYFKR